MLKSLNQAFHPSRDSGLNKSVKCLVLRGFLFLRQEKLHKMVNSVAQNYKRGEKVHNLYAGSESNVRNIYFFFLLFSIPSYHPRLNRNGGKYNAEKYHRDK